jgi:hypothetical protein
MPRISGYLLIATGILHNAIGVLIGYPQLRDIALAGFFNTVDSDIYRQAIFWFLFSGFLMILIGQLFLSMKTPIPAGVGLNLLLLCVVGAILMPASGFWLGIPQAVYIIVSSRRATPARTAAVHS